MVSSNNMGSVLQPNQEKKHGRTVRVHEEYGIITLDISFLVQTCSSLKLTTHFLSLHGSSTVLCAVVERRVGSVSTTSPDLCCVSAGGTASMTSPAEIPQIILGIRVCTQEGEPSSLGCHVYVEPLSP